MKREEISEAVSNIDPKFILEAETYSWKKRRIKKLFRGSLAAAAILCLAILLQTLPATSPAGIFTVKAYALDLDESGQVVLREEDLLEKSDYWGGYCDGENYFINMGLRYEGENIESVTFTTEEGFFARQQITPGMSEDQVSKMYIGPENQLIVFGEDFDICGDSVTLEGSEMEEGLLLFWGVRAASEDDIPKNPRITATAVFQNGSTQTIDINLDLSGTAVFGGHFQQNQETGLPVAYYQSQYYKSLPLEKCELVDEQTVTDVYEYMVDDYTITVQVPEASSFDEDGLYRIRRFRISGAFYLPVFQLEDGACIARLYKVPRELEYSQENAEKAGLLPGTTGSGSAEGIPPSEEPASNQGTVPAESTAQQSTREGTPQSSAAFQKASEKKVSSPQLESGSGYTVTAGKATPEQMHKMQAWSDYYDALSLTDCELLENNPVTDKFVFTLNAGTGVVYPEEVKDLFNDDGYFRSAVSSGEEGTFIAGLYRDPQGTVWGQVYRVPEELVYENTHPQ